MKALNSWSFLLSLLLITCAANPQSSTVAAKDVNSSRGSLEEHPSGWSFPEQESWVEEPVFNGSLHLVEAGLDNPNTIILIHGLGERGIIDWAQVFPRLTDEYHVVAIDLPGFGSSDKQQIQYAPQKYAQLVNWVVSQYAHGHVTVIGHSMGGAVSLRYAHNYPEQVSRLIMIDAAGILQRTVFIKHIAKVPDTYEWSTPYQAAIPALDRLIKRIARKADGWTQSLLITMDRLPDVPHLMMTNGLAQKYLYRNRSSMNAALGLVYEDFSTAAREVDIPTHIIWGELDRVAPIRTGIVLANVMPDAELHVIRGSGHVPMMDDLDGFMSVLTYALKYAPLARQAQKRLMGIENEGVMGKSNLCDGHDNLLYTGHYKVIRLRNCRDVVLRDVVAESIELVGSEALLENVKLNSPDTGLSAVNSVITATLLKVEANVGMVVENSYLDLAGADFVTRQELVKVRSDSQLYFSLSENLHDKQVTPLHGISLGGEFKIR